MSHKKDALSSLKKGYFKAPNELFDLGLSPAAVMVYCFFASCGDAYDPPMASIAERLDLNRKTVARAVGELEVNGLIGTENVRCGGTKTRKHWWFIDPAEWPTSPEKTGPKKGLAQDQKTDSGQAEERSLTIKKETTKKQEGTVFLQEAIPSSEFNTTALSAVSTPPLSLLPNSPSGKYNGEIEKLQRMADHRKGITPPPNPTRPQLGLGPSNLSQEQLESIRENYRLQGRDPDEAGYEEWRWPVRPED